MILVELPRDTAADLIEPGGLEVLIASSVSHLLATHWIAGGAGAVRSRLKTQETCGVMNYHDMDLLTNESVYDSVGAMDQFAHGGVIDLWNDTPGLGQCGQAFNCGN